MTLSDICTAWLCLRLSLINSVLLTVWAVFLPQGLHLALGEPSLGVHLEVGDALIECLHVSVLHGDHLLLVSVPLEILWTVQRQIS